MTPLTSHPSTHACSHPLRLRKRNATKSQIPASTSQLQIYNPLKPKRQRART